VCFNPGRDPLRSVARRSRRRACDDPRRADGAARGRSADAEAQISTSALDRDSTRVVSCNTTSIVRTLTALKRAGLLRRARGTLLRRATDLWESHQGGIMNMLVPEPEIPSRQRAKCPERRPGAGRGHDGGRGPRDVGHLHYWSVQLRRRADKEDVLGAFRSSSRIALIRTEAGLTALNTVKELMADLGRPHDNLYEVALWADMLKVEGDELFYAYMVDNQAIYAYTADNQAIVIPETIDAIRALTGQLRSSVIDRQNGYGARDRLGYRSA
jgi:glyceraldehyde-3-phosphate dehydrogenase (NAD(P))